jgi:hypothetical protein
VAVTTIADLRDTAAALIAGITPNFEPSTAFVEASYNQALEELDPTHSPKETTRQFHVLPWNFDRLGRWYKGSTDIFPVQRLRVKIRYWVPREEPDWYLRWAKLWACDQADLVQRLVRTPSPTTWGDGTALVGLRAPSLFQAPVPTGQPGGDITMMVIDFALFYELR